MTAYTANTAGSTSFNFPSKIAVGDTLRFNVTNTDNATQYTGTMIHYTLPVSCKVNIRAYGARGSYGNLYTYGVSNTSRSGNGAYVYGIFEFAEGDELLMICGQHGRDAMTGTSSTKDQTTGGGGGATTIAKRVASSSYKMVGHTENNSTQYAGWYLTPLIIAAGGNGSRDNGYSGTGTIYNGGAVTTSAEALGNTGSSSTYLAGGTFSKQVSTTWSNSSSYRHGLSFLYGGLGARYQYKRTSTAGGGFGGGGGNTDDGMGGGGGGWISGCRRSSNAGKAASSYINTTLGTSRGSTAGSNSGHGYIIFEFKEVYSSGPTIYTKLNSGSVVPSTGIHVYVNSSIKFSEATDIYVKTSAGWKQST